MMKIQIYLFNLYFHSVFDKTSTLVVDNLLLHDCDWNCSDSLENSCSEAAEDLGKSEYK